ncbi:MAG: DEAD/DEAH box helicase [Actinobacteria bacterium]|nr:DEAD/DEAH box helicase [Actinomycetota bacterium]
MDSLTERGITAPFPIQTATLPDTLAGRDVLGRGRTGSGKTLAFALPLVARLAGIVPSGDDIPRRSRPGRPRALVLAPTRELATQIAETITPLGNAVGLTTMTIFGGVNQKPQVDKLRGGIDIVVATPGRLEDLMGQRHVSLDDVTVTVLDEADHMADLGFLPGVTRIMRATPPTGQRMLFSATLDRGVDKLVKQFLHAPLQHSVDPAESAVVDMEHHVFFVPDAAAKADVVQALASGDARRLLFTRTKHQAKKLARQLTSAGIPAVELHGNLSQNARERGLEAFHSGEIRVMVATDIAARGIHVDDVDLVVHVDPPAEHKAYLHRSGRTARAGNGGDVVTLVLPEQRADFRTMARAARIDAAPATVRASDPRVTALVGDVAAPVDPARAPLAAARKPVAQPQGRAKKAGSGTAATATGRRRGAGGGSGQAAARAPRATAALRSAPARTAPAPAVGRRGSRRATAPSRSF